MSGGENGGSPSDREQDPVSSPEGSKPNSCYTPEPPDPPTSPEESRYSLPKAGGPDKDAKVPVSPGVEGPAGSVHLPVGLRANRPPLEVLKKIFPAHKPPVLELILRGCGGDLVGAIEVLLSSRGLDGSAHPLGDAQPEALPVLASSGPPFEPPGLGSYHPASSSSAKWSVGSAFRVPESLRFTSDAPPGSLGVPLQHPSFAQPARYPLMLRSSLTRGPAGGAFTHGDVTLWNTVALQQQYQLRSAAQYVSPFAPAAPSGFRSSALVPSRPPDEQRVSIPEESCPLGPKAALFSPEEEYEERSDSADSRILSSSS